MSRRGENIRKRQDGRWEGRFKNGTDSTGRSKYQSVYGKTYSEVKKKLTEARENSIKNFYPTKNYNFAEVLELWLKASKIKIKASTETKYEYMINRHILPELGGIKVSDLNTVIINSFLDKKLHQGRLNVSGGLSPAYVQTISIIINSALKFAASEEMCRPLKNPILKPALDRKTLDIFNPDEQLKLEKYLLHRTDETKMGIFIALHTGMRIGEICALKWDDVELDDSIIKVNSTVTRIKSATGPSTCLTIGSPKTKASLREIPISSILMPTLADMHKKRKSTYVVSDTHDFVATRTFDYRYRKILKSAEIAEKNFHTLRHTFATRCINAGVDVKTLSEILGHANVGITLNTYVHPSMEMKKSQLEKLYTAI